MIVLEEGSFTNVPPFRKENALSRLYCRQRKKKERVSYPSGKNYFGKKNRNDLFRLLISSLQCQFFPKTGIASDEENKNK